MTDRVFEMFKEHKVLTGIVLGGFLLRVSGIFWGIPFPDSVEGDYNPDEVLIIKGAVQFPGHVLSNLQLFYPTFFHYLLGIITFPLQGFFSEFGLPGSGEHASGFYYVVTLIGRLCSVLAGTATIVLTYLLARDVFDKKRAVLASAFLAFTLYHVTNSALATTDVLTSFFFTLFLYVLRQAFLKPESTLLFLYSGIVLGLTIGTKYTAAIVVWAMVVLYGNTMWMQLRHHENCVPLDHWKFHKNLLLCGVAALVTFFLTTPGILLHVDAFIESINYVRTDLVRFSSSRTEASTWIRVFETFGVAVGVPLACLFILGLIFPFKKNVYEWSFIAILVVFVVYFEATILSRYFILIAPLVAMLASNGAMWVYESDKKPFKILGGSLIAIVLLYSFGSSAIGAYGRMFDIRTQAGRYVQEMFPQGTSIGTGYTSEELGQSIHYWRYPILNDKRFRFMDFLEFPEVVMVSSGGGWNMGWALESEKLSKDYVWDDRFNYFWWQSSPPSPRVFRFYKETLYSELSPYVRVKTFKPAIPLFLEYTPPEFNVYVRQSYGPQMIRRNYYANNSRGYFQEEDTRKWRWQLRLEDGNEAELVFPSKDREVVRIAITHAESDLPWGIQLNQMPVEIQKNHEYVLRFRARADTSRSMAGAVGQTFSPWQTIGLYQQVMLTDEWKDYEMSFRAEADESHSRVFFDLGASAVSVEIADVTLHHQSGFLLTSFSGPSFSASVDPERQERNEPGQTIEPDLPDKYYVDYQFNALGCRGRDYPIPRSQEGTRILILGDSLALGAGVHQADTLTSQLEGLLNSASPGEETFARNEVINCGVGGYGTQDAVRLYETLVSTYEPDVVLLVMAPDDDQSWIDEREQEAFDRLENPGKKFLAWSRHQERSFNRQAPDYSRSLGEMTRLEQLVQANGGRLGVVAFRYSSHRAWESLIQQLSQSIQGGTVPMLDLGKSLFPHHSENELFVDGSDKHPNEMAHRLAAQSIRDFLIKNRLVKKESIVALDINL